MSTNKRKSKYPPYANARVQALELHLNSRQQYIDWHTDTKCKYLPRYPERVYTKEWVSWNDWLGTANVFKGDLFHQKPVRPFWEAIKWAHDYASLHKLDTMADWVNYTKEHEEGMPVDIPMRPDQCQLYLTEWPAMGWKGWLGTDTRKVLEVAKKDTALLCLCSHHTLSKPGNVYAVVMAEKGEAELRNVLVNNTTLAPIRVYKLLGEDRDRVVDMLGRYGRRESDGWFIPNIQDLLFDMDMELAPHPMAPIEYPSNEPTAEEVEMMMFGGPGAYKHRV